MNKKALVLLLAVAGAAYATSIRKVPTVLESFARTNGSPVIRAILTPDNSTAEDNTTAAGGSAVTYTFLGGERVCVQAITTDAYVQVIAAASQTTANSFLVTAGQSILANCYTLQATETKISALCTASGPCTVKLFEVR